MVIDFNSIKVRLNQSDNLFYMLANLAFQFHKGTIKPLSAQRETLSVKYFNSIKVRLNPLFVTILSRGYHNFNSIKVRLNLERVGVVGVFRRHFNSIKVRLNLIILKACLCVVGFQFHKGTIKPPVRAETQRSIPQFQFHKGTIKPLSVFERCSLIHISIP